MMYKLAAIALFAPLVIARCVYDSYKACGFAYREELRMLKKILRGQDV